MNWLEKNAAWLSRAERWRCQNSEPLCLRAWFESCEVGWDPWFGLTCEGALQWAVILLETGRIPSDVFGGVGDADVDVPIPIEDVVLGGMKIACASQGVFPSMAIEQVRRVRKRTDVEALSIRKVQTQGGEHKSLDLAKPTMAAPFVDFFVRGDRKKLEELAPHAATLGVMRSAGVGAIRGWEILDDPLDRSLTFDGAPQRAIPLGSMAFEAGQFDERVVNTRVPYWHRRSAALCAVPMRRA